jgi:anti-anti-sigma factor
MSADRSRMPDPPQLEVHVGRLDGRTVVAFRGELDLASADRFSDAIREHLPGGPVLIDLRELSFMGSSGIQALDALMRDAEREGWTFTIRSELQRPVERVLTLTGLLSILPLEDIDSSKERR